MSAGNWEAGQQKTRDLRTGPALSSLMPEDDLEEGLPVRLC